MKTTIEATPQESLLTIKQAAQKLNVSERQIYRLLAEGMFAIVMIGIRSPRIRPSELERYIASRTRYPDPNDTCA